MGKVKNNEHQSLQGMYLFCQALWQPEQKRGADGEQLLVRGKTGNDKKIPEKMRKERRMNIVDRICICVLALVILYVIFAPWLAQISISKNTNEIAKELEEINKTLKELKSNAERKESK